MKTLLLSIAVNFAAVSGALSATVPDTFVGGEVADAAEVNANFSALVSAITALEEQLASATPAADLTGKNYCIAFFDNGVGIADDGSYGTASIGQGYDAISFTSSSAGSATILSESFKRILFYGGSPLEVILESDDDTGVEGFTYTMVGNKLSITWSDGTDEFFMSADGNSFTGVVGEADRTTDNSGTDYFSSLIVGVRTASCN